jgi:hypothetical protein
MSVVMLRPDHDPAAPERELRAAGFRVQPDQRAVFVLSGHDDRLQAQADSRVSYRIAIEKASPRG